MNHAVLPLTVASKMLNPAGRMIHLGSACVAILFGLLSLDARADTPVNERLGVAHVHGTYHLTNEDFLNEGADQVLKLGARVIKVYLTLDTDLPAPSAYAFNTKWPEAKTLVDLTRTQPFRRLFDKRFTTFVLTTFGPGRPAGYWLSQITNEQEAEEERTFYELARELLSRYKGTGKTFVLQNWEGDWAVRGAFDPKFDPTDSALDNMTRWLNARQRGVEHARAELRADGVHVWHAVEVNLVLPSFQQHRPGVIDRVIPRVRPDLVSYSAWESLESPDQLKETLDFIARHTPSSSFGKKNVYIGEFGVAENQRKPADVSRILSDSMTAAREWGCPFILYWQVYCNEAVHQPVKSNSDVRGFWLLRPDGTKAIAWPILENALRS